MYDVIVTATNINKGIYREYRGWHNNCVGLDFNKPNVDFDEGAVTDEEFFRNYHTWACNHEDVDKLVEKLSAQWPGYEIKVFNLSSIKVRAVGELKSKRITEDGVLPE